MLVTMATVILNKNSSHLRSCEYNGLFFVKNHDKVDISSKYLMINKNICSFMFKKISYFIFIKAGFLV